MTEKQLDKIIKESIDELTSDFYNKRINHYHFTDGLKHKLGLNGDKFHKGQQRENKMRLLACKEANNIMSGYGRDGKCDAVYLDPYPPYQILCIDSEKAKNFDKQYVSLARDFVERYNRKTTNR